MKKIFAAASLALACLVLPLALASAAGISTNYTLTYIAGANGTISGSTTQTVSSGSDGTAVTAVPNSGYVFSGWSDSSMANPRTDTSVASNITVTANFSAAAVAPTITGITSVTPDGTYSTGATIEIDLTFSAPVTSTGPVVVSLGTGTTTESCSFTVASSAAASCNYIVQAGDSASDLNVTSVSGSIADGSSTAMTNFVPASNLADTKAIVINTSAPAAPVIAGGSSSFSSVSVMSGSSGSAGGSGSSASASGSSSGGTGSSGTESSSINILGFIINDGKATTTASAHLSITMNADANFFKGYMISLSPSFAGATMLPYTVTQAYFDLPHAAGNYTVYLKYFSDVNRFSDVISRSIGYACPAAGCIDSSVLSAAKRISSDLQVNSIGAGVSALQAFLAAVSAGPAARQLAAHGTTRFFGPLTQAALAEFQSWKSIAPASGYFGPKTRAALASF